MPTTDFASEILETEIVRTHIENGHVYHFPILSNGIVSLHGSRIEANLKPSVKAAGISSTRVTRPRRRSGARMCRGSKRRTLIIPALWYAARRAHNS